MIVHLLTLLITRGSYANAHTAERNTFSVLRRTGLVLETNVISSGNECV